MRRLTHPLWWFALAILVVNDLVLKRSSLAGVITGKLSDFAGLIGAPLLVVALVRPRTHALRLVCFGVVVIPFVAIKVSTTAASMLIAVASLIEMKWRIWSDWTDLVALSILPIAWRLSLPAPPPKAESEETENYGRIKIVVHRVGVILGALACMATSEDRTTIESSVYLVNVTQRKVDVFLFRAKDPPDCTKVLVDPRTMLKPEQFAFDRCWSPDKAAYLPLDHDVRVFQDAVQVTDASAAGVPRVCDAVVIRAAGMRDMIVFWNRVPKVSLVADDVTRNSRDPHALYIERFGDTLVLERTPLVDAWPVDGWILPQPPRCEETPPP